MQEMAGHTLSNLYLLAVGCSFERKKIAEKIASFIPSSAFYHSNLEVSSLESVLDELNTGSLFQEKVVVFLEGIEKLKKWDALLKYIQNPNKEAFLILGVSSLKPVADLYQKGKKEIVALDLSEEKPWEKESRLQQFIVEEVKKKGKRLSHEAVRFLIENVGLERAALTQEIAKVVCFVGAKENVELQDLQAICSFQNETQGWQWAEGVVWTQDKMKIPSQIEDLGFIVLLIGQLRYHLQQGYQLSSLLEYNMAPQEIATKFPQLKKGGFEKHIGIARQKKSAYFLSGLNALYKLELGVKTSLFSPSLLFDRFLATLRSSS